MRVHVCECVNVCGVYVCVCMFIWIYRWDFVWAACVPHVRGHIFTSPDVYMCMCVCVCVCLCVYACVRVFVYVQALYVYIYIHTYM